MRDGFWLRQILGRRAFPWQLGENVHHALIRGSRIATRRLPPAGLPGGTERLECDPHRVKGSLG